jgi:hypothetical protein
VAVAVIEREMTIAEAADRVSSWLPGHRVEILKGSILVAPPPDGPHQGTVFEAGYEIRRAGAKQAGLKARPGSRVHRPEGDKYSTVTPYKRGSALPLPDSVGVAVDLSVYKLLDGDDD